MPQGVEEEEEEEEEWEEGKDLQVLGGALEEEKLLGFSRLLPTVHKRKLCFYGRVMDILRMRTCSREMYRKERMTQYLQNLYQISQLLPSIHFIPQPAPFLWLKKCPWMTPHDNFSVLCCRRLAAACLDFLSPTNTAQRLQTKSLNTSPKEKNLMLTKGSKRSQATPETFSSQKERAIHHILCTVEFCEETEVMDAVLQLSYLLNTMKLACLVNRYVLACFC
jgi:hypothetical protein